MKPRERRLFTASVLLVVGYCFTGVASQLPAALCDPEAADYSGRKGKTIYVSKLGDNSDGSSWQKAFHTIQAALLALPDNRGGHTDRRPARHLRRGESVPRPSRRRERTTCWWATATESSAPARPAGSLSTAVAPAWLFGRIRRGPAAIRHGRSSSPTCRNPG